MHFMVWGKLLCLLLEFLPIALLFYLISFPYLGPITTLNKSLLDSCMHVFWVVEKKKISKLMVVQFFMSWFECKHKPKRLRDWECILWDSIMLDPWFYLNSACLLIWDVKAYHFMNVWNPWNCGYSWFSYA